MGVAPNGLLRKEVSGGAVAGACQFYQAALPVA